MVVNLAGAVTFYLCCKDELTHILKHSNLEHAQNLTNACALILGRTFVAPKSAYGKWDTSLKALRS